MVLFSWTSHNTWLEIKGIIKGYHYKQMLVNFEICYLSFWLVAKILLVMENISSSIFLEETWPMQCRFLKVILKYMVNVT